MEFENSPNHRPKPFITPWCHVMLLASFVYATRDSLDVIMPFIVNTRSLNGTSYMSYSKIYKTLGEAVLADVPYKIFYVKKYKWNLYSLAHLAGGIVIDKDEAKLLIGISLLLGTVSTILTPALINKFGGKVSVVKIGPVGLGVGQRMVASLVVFFIAWWTSSREKKTTLVCLVLTEAAIVTSLVVEIRINSNYNTNGLCPSTFVER
ncbi:unnamed protein product [Tenebrio molitor]|nr:unnamed protein product [Tenebrio molitor]